MGATFNVVRNADGKRWNVVDRTGLAGAPGGLLVGAPHPSKDEAIAALAFVPDFTDRQAVEAAHSRPFPPHWATHSAIGRRTVPEDRHARPLAAVRPR